MAKRFADIESISEREAINDYLQSPLVSLKEATVPIGNLVPDIMQYATTAKLLCAASVDSLTEEESAAIYLYTMGSPFYEKLNTAMRSIHMNHVKPYFLYLKLFYTALGKLPCKKTTVWRGIRANVSSTYVEGKHVIWHSASSSSTDASVVTSFLDKNYQCTLFQIDCQYGKSISKYSAFPSENEILLIPGTKLLVRHKPFEFNGFQLVQLEETLNPNMKKTLIIPPSTNKSITSTKLLSKSAQLKPTPATVNPIPVFPVIKIAKAEEAKSDNCE
jgi:hypothetical protein